MKQKVEFVVWSDVHVDVTDTMYTRLEDLGDTCLNKVLLLAGDIADTEEDIQIFLKHCGSRFEHVFYTPGNHEHWGRTEGELRYLIDTSEHIPGNVTFLQREAVTYKGVHIIGATLWTDYNDMDPLVLDTVRHSMACDFGSMDVTAHTLYYRHIQDKGFIFTELMQNSDKPCVVMTHHGCTSKSVSEHYNNPLYYATNYAYYSELSRDILDVCEKRLEPMKWVHGHMHNTARYDVGDMCEVVLNPFGYSRFQTDFETITGFTFETEAEQ